MQAGIAESQNLQTKIVCTVSFKLPFENFIISKKYNGSLLFYFKAITEEHYSQLHVKVSTPEVDSPSDVTVLLLGELIKLPTSAWISIFIDIVRRTSPNAEEMINSNIKNTKKKAESQPKHEKHEKHEQSRENSKTCIIF